MRGAVVADIPEVTESFSDEPHRSSVAKGDLQRLIGVSVPARFPPDQLAINNLTTDAFKLAVGKFGNRASSHDFKQLAGSEIVRIFTAAPPLLVLPSFSQIDPVSGQGITKIAYGYPVEKPVHNEILGNVGKLSTISNGSSSRYATSDGSTAGL